MAIAAFPHRYSVDLDDDGLTMRARAALPIGPPPQFGGTGERDWSPEELLLGAVVACLKTTFDAYARRAALPVSRFHAAVDGTLDKSREGPVFTAIHITVDLEVAAADEARARETLARAERDCIISRALKASVHLDVHVEPTSAEARAS